jgi:hypothetical protein
MIVFVDRVSTAGGVDVALVTSPWSEGSVTFNTQPTVGAPFASNIGVSTTLSYVTFDITSQVQAWVTGAVTNYGVAITAAVAAPSTSIVLDAKENTSTSHPAFIDVVLSNTGPTGPAGPTGATGATGPAGATGATGPSGLSGLSGLSGPAGPSGPSGPSGAAGVSGTNGNTILNGTGAPSGVGVNGDFYLDTSANCLYGPKASGNWPGGCASLVGPSGLSGLSGLSGPAGPSGLSGLSGPAGPSGLSGLSGPAGASGLSGLSGPAGPSGLSGTPGTDGINGTNGNAVLNGTAAPGAGTGVNGDFYINTTAHCIYGPKAAGAWPGTCTSLVGPSGLSGLSGVQGLSGPSGLSGANGSPGPTGPSGPTGPAGSDGTGQSPTGIPLMMFAHNMTTTTSPIYVALTGANANATASSVSAAVVPNTVSSCKPTATITPYLGAVSITWTINSATVTNSNVVTVGSAITGATCTTNTNGGACNTATVATVGANAGLILVGTLNSGSLSSNTPIYTAFSCQ